MKVQALDIDEALRLINLGVTLKLLTTPAGRQWYEFLDKDERTILIAKNMPTAWGFIRGLAHAKGVLNEFRERCPSLDKGAGL